MKFKLPQKRWIILFTFLSLFVYFKMDEFESKKPENICRKQIAESILWAKSNKNVSNSDVWIDFQTIEEFGYKSLFRCSGEIVKFIYKYSKKGGVELKIQAQYKSNDSFDITDCRRQTDCRLIRFIESAEFRQIIVHDLKVGLRITIGGMTDKTATEFKWTEKGIETRVVPHGNFASVQSVLSKYPKVYDAEVQQDNPSDLKMPIFQSIFKSIQQYFPYHAIQYRSQRDGYPEPVLQQIKIIAKEDKVYDPEDTTFTKIRNELSKQLCEKLEGFEVFFMPFNRYDLGLEMQISNQKCKTEPEKYTLSVFYPTYSDYTPGYITPKVSR